MLNRGINYGEPSLWVRPVYKKGFDDQTITTVVRIGDRSHSDDPRFIPLNTDIPVRFIERVGFEKKNVPPALYPDDGMTVLIVKKISKRIKDLTRENLNGAAPDSITPELVRYHLGTINNTELPHKDDLVTIYHFIYQPKVNE